MKSVDLRPVFQQWGLDVRRQGERGTCSVFTLADAAGYALAARNGGAGTLLSVEFLNWAANQVRTDTGDGGCFDALWAGYDARGICAEDAMPYQATFDPQRVPSAAALEQAQKLRAVGLKLHWIKNWDPSCGVSDNQLAQIKRKLDDRVPVCGGFLWPKEDPRYPGGILEMPPREGMRDGHSVLLVGYTDDPSQPGGGLLIFRNTSKGYPGASMTYAYARAYMNDAAWIDCTILP